MARALPVLATFVLSLGLLVAPASARSKLRQGDHGVDVLHLNEALAGLGYLPKESATSNQFDLATYHAVVAFQKIARLDRTGVAGPGTRRRLRTAHRPHPRTKGTEKRIDVDLSEQVALLIRGRRVVRAIAISSAAPGYLTPYGHWKVLRKEHLSYSVPYRTWLPWASYFYGGVAFHEYPDVPVYAASHGCVRVPGPFARDLYLFASPGVPVTVVR